MRKVTHPSARSHTPPSPRDAVGRAEEARLATWDEIDTAGRVWTVSTQPGRSATATGSCSRYGAAGRWPVDATEDALVARDRRRAARLPVVVQGLGCGGNGPSTSGHRGSTGARRGQPGRGGLYTVGPDWVAAESSGRIIRCVCAVSLTGSYGCTT